jgi:hypothetical protein
MTISADALTSLATFKAFLGITATTDNTILEDSINRASAMIQRFCARNFVSQRYYEWHDTYGADRVMLRHNPVEHVRFVGVGYDNVVSVVSTVSTDISVTIGVDTDHVHLHRINSSGVETSAETAFATYPSTNLLAAAISGVTGFSASAVLNVPTKYLRKIAGADLKQKTIYLQAPTDQLTDYMVDDANGIIYGPTLRQYRSFLVDYEGGYSTVPYDVEQAAISIATRLYRGRQRDPGVSSESLGGYSYSLRSGSELDAEMRSMLDPWRRLR